jgi:hypothetical protein
MPFCGSGFQNSACAVHGLLRGGQDGGLQLAREQRAQAGL